MRKTKAILIILVTLCSMFVQMPVFAADAPEVNWVNGPAKADVTGYATIDLSDEYLFANKEDTVKIMKYYGNLESKAEIGSVYPKNTEENWFIIFEYFEEGHIKDSEKNTIDADKLLETYTENTENSNKERVKQGMTELRVIGWMEEPKYNEELHSLTWCTLLESDNGKSANHEARLLCREGYVAATLVCTDTELEKYKIHMKQVIDKFAFNEGKRYEDYVEGQDKLSDYGLAALIVGGTAVAAKKGIFIILLAFLKKGGIILFVPIIAFFKKLFSRKNKTGQVSPDTTLTSDVPSSTDYSASDSVLSAQALTAASSDISEASDENDGVESTGNNEADTSNNDSVDSGTSADTGSID